MADPIGPFDLVAERAMLGSVLIEPRRIDDVLPALVPEDLSAVNGMILAAMRDIVADNPNADPDVSLVLSRLRADRSADAPPHGWAHALAELMDNHPLVGNLREYCDLIVEAAMRARLRVAAMKISSAAHDASLSAPEALAEIQSAVAIAAETAVGQTLVRIGAPVEHELERCIEPQRDEDVVATGFEDLDAILAGGLRPQQFIVLAARTGQGKSALAANIAEQVAAGSGAVLFCSLEMSIEQLSQRYLAAGGEVSLTAIRSRNLASASMGRLQDAAGRLAKLPLFVQAGAAMRVGDIIAAARQLKRKGGLRLIVVDYVQLLLPDRGRRFESREREVASITRALKVAAQELQVPVLCLAQLSRKADEGNAPPSLSHLRESGALEQDADVVLFVHRDKSVGQPATGATEAQIIIAKNRDGRCHYVNVQWHGSQVRFMDPPQRPRRREREHQETFDADAWRP